MTVNGHGVIDKANTRDVIMNYWQEIVNYWRVKDPKWYEDPIAFHRQIWLSCNDMVRATDFKFDIGLAADEVEFDVDKLRDALAKIWFAGGCMVVSSILNQHDGEYSLMHANAISRQFRDMWEGDYDEAHFFDYVEVIVCDACATHQINMTCLRALSDIAKLSLDDLCVIPDDHR